MTGVATLRSRLPAPRVCGRHGSAAGLWRCWWLRRSFDLVGVRAGLVMRKVFVGLRCVLCTAPDVVVMKIHDSVIELRTGLRMMMLIAGVLAVLLVCAGTAAGATWVVDDSGGAGVDYANMQAAVATASEGGSIGVWGGSCVWGCGLE